MNAHQVIIVRVYLMESSGKLNTVVDYLTKEAKIRGLTIFRAISGYGDSGGHHTSLIDMSLNLPLVIEFFDSKDKVEPALEHLQKIIKPEHMVYWQANSI